MNYTVKPLEKSSIKFTLSFDETEWKNANTEAYNKTKGRYQINGFRKGKVPKSIIERNYGTGCFYEEAINILFNKHYGEILEKEQDNYTVVSDPQFEIEKISDNEVSFSLTVAIKPDVEIKAYTGIKVDKVEYNVTDADVELEIKKLQDRNSRLVDVTDRKTENGDTANIDFSGSVNGEKFEGGTATGYDLVLGSGSFIPGFEEQVVGMAIGEEKDINVKFPEEYQAEELKGKDAVFTVKVNAIKTRELPEVTDEFIKESTGKENLEVYKKETFDKLKKDAEKRSNEETENNIIKAIMKDTKCDIPQAMIDTQIDQMIKQMEYRLSYQGIKLDDYLKYMGVKMEDFRKNYEDTAKDNILSQLIVEKIIKEQNFTAEQAEIDDHIAKDAQSVGKEVEEYKKNMDPRQVEYIKNEIVVNKLFTYLRENNELVVSKEKKEEKAN